MIAVFLLGVTVLQLGSVVRSGLLVSSVAAASLFGAIARAQDESPAPEAAGQNSESTPVKPNAESEQKDLKNTPSTPTNP
ncbi:hypothetical protein EBR21_15110, partial [bacterium]|nr:hypothetical protein [bacterium]